MAKFNRFTTISVLLDMLGRKRLVLLDPSTWEDKNDSEVMAAYKKRKGLQGLLALCGSNADETIHHWKTFADGISGCCIEFDLAKLSSLPNSVSGIRHGRVTYKRLSELKNASENLDSMPFTKRWPYRCEQEYRILWEGSTAESVFEIEFDLAMINLVTISQRMPQRSTQPFVMLCERASSLARGSIARRSMRTRSGSTSFRRPNMRVKPTAATNGSRP